MPKTTGLSLLEAMGLPLWLDTYAYKHNDQGYARFDEEMRKPDRPTDEEIAPIFGVTGHTIGNWRRVYDNKKSKEKK